MIDFLRRRLGVMALGMALLLPTLSAQATSTLTDNRVLPITQAQSDLPGPGRAGVYAIRTAKQLTQFQSEHRIGLSAPVDFSRDMVIAVLLGTRNTSGYKVAINEIRNEGWVTEVSYAELKPSPTQAVAQALTNPYLLAVIRQTPHPVVFTQGHFQTVRVPYGEFSRWVRTVSELSYSLQDAQRQKAVAESRVRDLVDLMARTGQPAQ